MGAKDGSRTILGLILLSFVILMLGNNVLSLTNPDEVFYAGTAKEMAQQRTWMVPYLFGKPQFEKPILTYWLLRAGFLAMGVSGFSARLFPSLFAILGVVAVYLFCFRIHNDRNKAFFCAVVLATSCLYIGLARTVFTDMIFSVFILLSLLAFYLGYVRNIGRGASILLCFIFSALAVLTKGPLGFLIPFAVIVVFLAVRKDSGYLFCRHSIAGVVLFLLIAAPWYCFMIGKFGGSFTHEFFYNDHIRRLLTAEHKGNDTWHFYPLSMIVCMFPWSIFTTAALVHLAMKARRNAASPMHLFLLCWIIVVLAIFQMAHSKLVSYIFPLFPALAIITGDFICEAAVSNKRLIYGLSAATLAAFLSVPACLILAAAKYPMYAGPAAVRYGFIAFLAATIFAEFLILKNRLHVLHYALAFNMAAILSFALLTHEGFDEYVSSRHAAEYLKKTCRADDVILCSKFLVRGVRFYAENEAAVVNVGASNFFSPHPIPYLDTDEKARAFLRNQPLTYAVVNEGSLSALRRIAEDNLRCDVLKTFGDEYVVLIQPTSPRDVRSESGPFTANCERSPFDKCR